MAYEKTRDEAISNVERLAIEVIADRIAHGELPSSALGVSFTIPDEHLASQTLVRALDRVAPQLGPEGRIGPLAS